MEGLPKEKVNLPHDRNEGSGKGEEDPLAQVILLRMFVPKQMNLKR